MFGFETWRVKHRQITINKSGTAAANTDRSFQLWSSAFVFSADTFYSVIPSFLPSFTLPFTFHFPVFSSPPLFLFCFLPLPYFLCSSSPPSSLISFLSSSLFIPTSPNYNLSPLLSIYSNFYLILFSSLTYFPPPSFFPLYHPFITACSLLLSCPRPPSFFNLFLLSYLSSSSSSLPFISVLWEWDY